jgi:hypothetical protein
VNNQRRGLKSALTFCFRPEHELKPNPSRSRAAFPARPDILHGARGKYDPAKGIRQEHRRGNQSKPRSPGTFWPPEPFWDWVAIHTPGWCVAGDWLPAPYCRAQPGGASVPLRQIRTLTTDTTTKGAGLATVPRFNVGKTNRLSIFPWGNLSATLPPPKIPRLLLPGAASALPNIVAHGRRVKSHRIKNKRIVLHSRVTFLAPASRWSLDPTRFVETVGGERFRSRAYFSRLSVVDGPVPTK